MKTPRAMKQRLRRQGGFAYIAAVLLLVVVAGLAAAIVRLNAAQQDTANDALLVTRASQAARAGAEWMIYRISRTGVCQEVTLDLRADSGFRVTVTCVATGQFVEGWNPDAPDVPSRRLMYRVEATACNGAAARCPDDGSVAAPDYAERRRVATVCLLENVPAGAPAANNPLAGC